MSPDVLMLWGVLPAAVVSLAMLAFLWVFRRQPERRRARFVALFAGAAYLLGYYMLFGLPKPPPGMTKVTPEVWHAMFPAGVAAWIAAVVIETVWGRPAAKITLFVPAAALCTWMILPGPAKVPGQYAWYFAATFVCMVVWWGLLRVRDLPRAVPVAALCLTSNAAGTIVALFADNGRTGQPMLILSVPLGVIAVATVYRLYREATAGAVTFAALVLPGLLAQAYYFNEPADAALPPTISRWVFLLLGAVPLLSLIAAVPGLSKRRFLAGAVALGAVVLALAAVMLVAFKTRAAPFDGM